MVHWSGRQREILALTSFSERLTFISAEQLMETGTDLSRKDMELPVLDIDPKEAVAVLQYTGELQEIKRGHAHAF